MYKVKASNFLRQRTVSFKSKKEANRYASRLKRMGMFKGIKVYKK